MVGLKFYLAVLAASVAINSSAKELTSKAKIPFAEGVSSIANSLRNGKPAQVYGQIRMEGMQYFTPVPSQPQLTYGQYLSAQLSIKKETAQIDFMSDISAGTFFIRSQSHAVVHEAYMSTHGNGAWKFFLGRKQMSWSELDQSWKLGLWQPNYAIDALRPEEQGLSGLFVNYRGSGWELVGFVTPLFIPSMGPDIREEGGSLVSDSRWYRSPSQNYDFNNRINTIQYDISLPETAKLVGNGGSAVMLRMGDKEGGLWASASAGYLPVNELILKRKNFKDVSEDKVDVTVSPDLTYHGIYSIDTGYVLPQLRFALSYLQDEPMAKVPEQDWSLQRLGAIRAFSSTIDLNANHFFKRSLAFQLAYLKVIGGDIVDILSDKQPDDFTLFDHRLNFSNAVSLRVEGQITSFSKRPLVTRLKYLYDSDQRGTLVNTEFLYYPNQRWALLMGGDFLGVQNESSDSSFLNQYRANDRVYGGMTYVF